MFRFRMAAIVVFMLAGVRTARVVGDEPHVNWLKFIEGTWTWDDDERGKVTVTFKPESGGKCMLGTGKDKTGTFRSDHRMGSSNKVAYGYRVSL